MDTISTTFKAPVSTSESVADSALDSPKTSDPKSTHITKSQDSDIPLTIYKAEKAKPFSADYFGLGDLWGEYEEIGPIEEYLSQEVEEGRMDNSTNAAKLKLKQIEKMVNIDPTERQIVKLAKIKAYIDFLKETKDLERNAFKYGQHH